MKKDLKEATLAWLEAPKGKRCWETAAMAILSVQHLILWGVPGTGKTYTVAQWLTEWGIEWVRPILHETSSADEVRSYSIQSVDPETGSTTFTTKIGILLDAYMHGKTVLLDEMNRYSTEVLTLLFMMLDGSPIAIDVIGTGTRIVKPHSSFRVIGFSNDDVRTFPAGLIRRLEAKVEINDLSPGLWEKMPGSEALRTIIRDTALSEDDRERITGAEWQRVFAVYSAQAEAIRSVKGGSKKAFEPALALIVGEERAQAINTNILTAMSAEMQQVADEEARAKAREEVTT